jgi:hypothetical protein
MLRSLRETWTRKATDRKGRRDMDRREAERRKQERRKEQVPFDGPERRQGKDRRQYVRRVMSGDAPLPDRERRNLP